MGWEANPSPEKVLRGSARREVGEEVGITVLDLQEVARLDFYFPHIDSSKNWNQQVVVYFCKNWEGVPVETEEMLPQWFDLEDILYQKMWSDDKIWLPEVLKGNKVQAVFSFDVNREVEDQSIILIPIF